jgi:endonuclease/exonuclease/phosphatase family metal-dependent hydrolase
VVVRVLSYNIRSMRDDRRALVRVIRACGPDVVCIQEAPRFFRWRKHASWLARESGLVRVTGGATTCGTMILSSLRAHVEHTEDILLPRTPGLHQRGFATAVLRIGSTRLSVISAHLSINADERYEQAGLLLDRVATASYGAHPVVGGDFNDTPEGRSFRRIAAELQDCWVVKPWGAEFTSRSREPSRRLDAVFAGKKIEVLGCGVPIELPGMIGRDLRAATDHLPVLAALRVPAGA